MPAPRVTRSAGREAVLRWRRGPQSYRLLAGDETLAPTVLASSTSWIAAACPKAAAKPSGSSGRPPSRDMLFGQDRFGSMHATGRRLGQDGLRPKRHMRTRRPASDGCTRTPAALPQARVEASHEASLGSGPRRSLGAGATRSTSLNSAMARSTTQ